RSAAGCISAAKIASFLPKRRKTVASLTLRCGAFNGKNSQSLNAAPMRPELQRSQTEINGATLKVQGLEFRVKTH
ncbi:MAG: hypothetical protein J6T82_06830, partial [Bacteroidaceae bacterium]|nr:hypothetical protein [Bacteroidaceae bacterium]